MAETSETPGAPSALRGFGQRAPIDPRRSIGARLIRNLRAWHLLPLLAVLLVVALGVVNNPGEEIAAPLTPTNFPAPGFGAANFARAVADADGRIALGRERMQSAPGDWTSKEVLARGLMARANLTGEYRLWTEARQLLDDGMAVAPKGSGPVVAHATLAFSTHRLADVERDLALLEGVAVPPDALQKSGIAGLAGDVAFYRGDIPGAIGQYRRGASYYAGSAIDYRLAVLAMAEGRFADADAAIFKTISGTQRSPPRTLAEAAMRLGAHAMAQGKWEEADQWFARADALFPGYWLIAAHRAQAEALTGDPAKAAARMAAIADTSNSAEVMDATAMLYRTLGDGANSRRWATRAAALWAERLKQLPEAAYGHALEHELAFGAPERALDLAQKNVAQRPYGEARLLLASALLMNNRAEDALVEIGRAEKSGWRSAPLYAVKAEAAALAGRPRESQKARDQAQAINPRIFDPRVPRIWFSHG